MEVQEEKSSKVQPAGPEVQSSEADLGILEFLNPDNPGFPGVVIKERYSDFNVTEIVKTGELVVLDNQKVDIFLLYHDQFSHYLQLFFHHQTAGS